MENQKNIKDYEDTFVSPSEAQTEDPDTVQYPSEITNFTGAEKKVELK